MPLWKTIHPDFEGEIQIWQITEPDEYFLERLELTPAEEAELKPLKARRRTEWLASRLLIKNMLPGSQLECLKDRHGKPTLQVDPHFISISHSHDLVAVIVSRYVVGLDIQFLVEKITRIAHRVVSETELEHCDEDNYIKWLHVEWGAKEAMYKAYGLRSIDFRKQMILDPFTVREEGNVMGHMPLETHELVFDLYYEFIEDLCVVYCKPI